MMQVFVIEDQKIIASILKEYLEREMDIRVIGTARGVNEALGKINSRVDVITLDVELEDGNGLQFLEKFQGKSSTPVIMLSSFTSANAEITLQALSAGAFDFVAKADGTEQDFLRMITELKSKIWAAYIKSKFPQGGVRNVEISLVQKYDEYRKINLIALGASTGGVQAIEHIFKNLKVKLPPVLIVQHLPAIFTKLFTTRLNQLYAYDFIEVTGQTELHENCVYVAAGGYHLKVFSSHGKSYCDVTSQEKVNGHCPSVDVLFQSIADSGLAAASLGIILTGMGKDGAEGMLSMKQAGSYNIGQTEESSVVYGMPNAALKSGALDTQVDLFDIPAFIKTMIKNNEANPYEKTTDR